MLHAFAYCRTCNEKRFSFHEIKNIQREKYSTDLRKREKERRGKEINAPLQMRSLTFSGALCLQSCDRHFNPISIAAGTQLSIFPAVASDFNVQHAFSTFFHPPHAPLRVSGQKQVIDVNYCIPLPRNAAADVCTWKTPSREPTELYHVPSRAFHSSRPLLRFFPPHSLFFRLFSPELSFFQFNLKNVDTSRSRCKNYFCKIKKSFSSYVMIIRNASYLGKK